MGYCLIQYAQWVSTKGKHEIRSLESSSHSPWMGVVEREKGEKRLKRS